MIHYSLKLPRIWAYLRRTSVIGHEKAVWDFRLFGMSQKGKRALLERRYSSVYLTMEEATEWATYAIREILGETLDALGKEDSQ